MTLPNAVLEFLNNKAVEAGASLPKVDDDLFKSGVLDSFSFVDLISILEGESVNAIDRYVESRES
jgi:hypothetical protein